MPNHLLAINKCSWLPQGAKTRCNKNSINEFCGYHAMIAKQGHSSGPQPCIGGCGTGIRGKYKICTQCGGHKYRSIIDYNKRKNRPIPTPEEFIKSRNARISSVNISNARISSVNISNANISNTSTPDVIITKL